MWHADKHLVDAALSVDADEATVKRCRRSHRSTSFFPKSSMCCGTIAIDFTLLRKFTRMQLRPLASGGENAPTSFVHMLTSSTSMPFSFASPRPAYHSTWQQGL